jgi:hypothetical protein
MGIRNYPLAPERVRQHTKLFKLVQLYRSYIWESIKTVMVYWYCIISEKRINIKISPLKFIHILPQIATSIHSYRRIPSGCWPSYVYVGYFLFEQKKCALLYIRKIAWGISLESDEKIGNLCIVTGVTFNVICVQLYIQDKCTYTDST